MRKIEKPLELQIRQVAIVACLNRERLDVGPLDLGAQHVVLRGAPGCVELGDLGQPRRSELKIGPLELDHPLGQQGKEIGALHLDGEQRVLLLCVEAARLGEASGGPRRGDEAPALEERLREVGVERVGVRLAEHRVDGGAARVLERATKSAADPQLREQERAGRVELRLCDVRLRRAEPHLVADAQARGHRVLERQPERIRRRGWNLSDNR